MNKRVSAIVPADLAKYKIDMGRCTNGGVQLACLMSHIKTIFIAYRDNMEYALILEDDVEIERWPMWPALLATAPENWEILRFFVISDDLSDIFNSEKLWLENKGGWWGAAAHVIN